MNPQPGADDTGYFQSSNGYPVNRPLPAFSSPRSPSTGENDVLQHIPSPTSTFTKFETKRLAHDHPSPNALSRRQERSNSPSSNRNSPTTNSGHIEREAIIRSYAPHVAVYASPDVELLIADKGLTGGLATLLRPFGESIPGKVVVRDSHGISRAWEDFGIRIRNPYNSSKGLTGVPEANIKDSMDTVGRETSFSHDNGWIDWTMILKPGIETNPPWTRPTGDASQAPHSENTRQPSSGIYLDYLHRLLSSSPTVPYETFNHPVACLVAVSSRNSTPIETLRQLYALTGRTNPNIPTWMGTDYLRYYILIHDEDRDDVSKSVALFELMKRHFGLHCHLLRLRSSQCAFTDDDSFRIPTVEWLSAEESSAMTQREDSAEYPGDSEKSIFESDAHAIVTFIREMVTQSIIPFMENRVTAWNDQVASRKRGIGGRFMSMSKRWAGFGSLKSTNPAGTASSNPNGSNYNAELELYAPDTPEAIMRSLADHAMMLRDWRLAYNTYDLLRSDFGHDKAWAYHAAVNEMTALSSLLVPPQQLKLRLESVDQWLDAAMYSYLTRCSLPGKAKRCLLLAVELLHSRDPVTANRAPIWTARLLELSVLAYIEQCLVAERLAIFYSTVPNEVAQVGYPRHAAMWALIASLSWMQLNQPGRAKAQMDRPQRLHFQASDTCSSMPFQSMNPLWEGLALSVRQFQASSDDINERSYEQGHLDLAHQTPAQSQIDTFIADTKSHSRHLSHFTRKSEVVDKGVFSVHGDPNDGFE